jgi:type VI protein secretion system component VasK
MNRTILSFFTFVPSLLFGSTEVDPAAFLCAIAQVEGNSTTAIGKYGERSRYQFTGATWHSYSSMSFTSASCTDAISLAEQQHVAEKHLAWLQKNLPRPTVKRLAMAWNAGRGAVMRGEISAATKDYAERVHNLYKEELKGLSCYE